MKNRHLVVNLMEYRKYLYDIEITIVFNYSRNPVHS